MGSVERVLGVKSLFRDGVGVLYEIGQKVYLSYVMKYSCVSPGGELESGPEQGEKGSSGDGSKDTATE
jgi:hypothetical protein